MQPPDTAARQVLGLEIAAALPLDTLIRRVDATRGRSPGGPGVFRRELTTRPEHFRLLDPWQGPWQRNPRPRHPGREGPWVQLRTPVDRGPGLCRGQTVLAETLRVIGISVEADSFTALARWLHLVAEAGRAWEAAYASREKRTDRHSPSVSTRTDSKPELRKAA